MFFTNPSNSFTIAFANIFIGLLAEENGGA